MRRPLLRDQIARASMAATNSRGHDPIVTRCSRAPSRFALFAPWCGFEPYLARTFVLPGRRQDG
jgi:hypothetical protein